VTSWDADENRWSAWLVQAQQGDEAAYGSLLRELGAAIRAYLISRFGHLDILDDCVQECLLAVHQARHTYDGARPIRPWLFAIVRHRTIDLLRQKKSSERLVPETPVLTVDGPDMADTLTRGKLLGHLSHNLRDALVLTKFLGYSTRECADHLGVSESVVKIRVHRGIRKLKAMWDAEVM
jgi:RNA polymerase sigma-70 factor (ECF subfamily)